MAEKSVWWLVTCAVSGFKTPRQPRIPLSGTDDTDRLNLVWDGAAQGIICGIICLYAGRTAEVRDEFVMANGDWKSRMPVG